MQQSDPGSNSERSTDSPLPVSEDDSSGPKAPCDPEWTEERFRVDRKKLEVMLLGKSVHTYRVIYLQKVACKLCSFDWSVFAGFKL